MVLYEPLAALMNFPAELGILAPLFVAAALVILVLFIIMFLLEFVLGIFQKV